jgi:hypothetical protein
MPTYYDITLATAIPHGAGVLNQPCVVQFTYPGGALSGPYNATLFAWFTATTVRISSAVLNIDAAWVGANGGTLTINGTAGGLVRNITAFARVP